MFKFIAGALTRWLNHKSPRSEYPLCDFDRIRYELRPCDVVLVEGRSRVAGVIQMITQSAWSHAALYIGRLHDIEDPELRALVIQHYGDAPGHQLLVESELGLGTVVRPLHTYEGEHLRIARPHGLSHRDAQEIMRFAIFKLGTRYDIRQIFDLARFLFPWWILPRRYRSTLFSQSIGTQTRTVCSTMIAEAFNFVQFPILPLVKRADGGGVQLFRRNPRLVVPRDFDYSPYFDIIKYPFIDYSHHADYRLLPWHGKGVLTGTEAELYLHPAHTEALDAEPAPEAHSQGSGP